MRLEYRSSASNCLLSLLFVCQASLHVAAFSLPLQAHPAAAFVTRSPRSLSFVKGALSKPRQPVSVASGSATASSGVPDIQPSKPAKLATMKSLANYLSRIGLTLQPKANVATLALVMAAHSRAIAFENFDVVMGKRISMARPDVEKKLVDEKRGGYCWEQNTLLQMALEEMGFACTGVMCRVRWGKPDDSEEPNTTFTHFALKVATDSGPFLADVGFSGVNSMAPVNLGVGSEPQALPEGQFRVVDSKHAGFHVLELLIKGEWRPLYEWRDEKAPLVDQECSNWFSCTYPAARFTSQFFTCRIIGDERHHILNDEYVIRKGHGVEKQTTTERIESKARLLELIDTVFGVKLVETQGIDRFLQAK